MLCSDLSPRRPVKNAFKRRVVGEKEGTPPLYEILSKGTFPKTGMSFVSAQGPSLNDGRRVGVRQRNHSCESLITLHAQSHG